MKNIFKLGNRKSKKILVVEDDKFYASIFKKHLIIPNVEIVLAADGVEALKLTKEIKPDLILLDLILPRMNGFEYLKAVKEDESINKIKIMVLTNLGQEEDRQKAIDLGAVDFIIKSNVTFGEIEKRVKKNLQI